MTQSSRKNISLALNLLLIVLGMCLLTAASVPLYRLFCQVTGYGGTTGASHRAPDHIINRVFTVTFNADTDPGLPWDFAPAQHSVKVKVGEKTLIHYTAHNKTSQRITGHAVYNVVPFAAGGYFEKIQCFCFTEQTLEPNQTVDMPVLFFIDPGVMDDPDMKEVQTITLSYTFFPVKTDAKATAK